MLWRRRIRQLHRWLGLIVGLQVLLWVTGGLLMSALQLDAVRGERELTPPAPSDLRAAGELLDPAELLAGLTVAVRRVELDTLAGRPVYRVHAADGARLFDAGNGESLSPLPAALAERIALRDYAATVDHAPAQWVDTPATEYRGRELPLWRVRLDDGRGTAVYVSPNSGEVVARRNDLWRVFDFVWMLHIMDYDQRDDFNHPLLIITAATTLGFVITGIWMLVFSFRRRA